MSFPQSRRKNCEKSSEMIVDSSNDEESDGAMDSGSEEYDEDFPRRKSLLRPFMVKAL